MPQPCLRHAIATVLAEPGLVGQTVTIAAPEAIQAEETYVVARYAGFGQVGHDLAYHARELVAVPGAGTWRT